jgi:uncharacterized membrane protein YphA (DoxX/SURF4 family)
MKPLRWTLRILLAAVFVFAAYSKLKVSYLIFAMTIDAYQLLPEWAVLATARLLPPFELALGLALLIGWKLRYWAAASMALMLVFFAILLLSYARGLTIDCGCFGVGEPLSAYTLTRDGLLVAAAVALWWLSRPDTYSESTPRPASRRASNPLVPAP